MDNMKLTDEELDSIALTDDDIAELEQTATIGLSPRDHVQYKQSFEWLCNSRLKEKTAEAQYNKVMAGLDDKVEEIAVHLFWRGQPQQDWSMAIPQQKESYRKYARSIISLIRGEKGIEG
uniref:Uncharacterized protein n=2 Tax=viral metagenome TaxID=1070528 RepID=A0A6M3JK35_9ZZZZ